MNSNIYDGISVSTLSGTITSYSVPKNNYYHFIKRGFDIVASSMGLLFLWPLFLIVCLLIRIESKGNAMFTQERVGLNGKRFKMFKFRSMYLGADQMLEELMANDPKLRKEYMTNKKLSKDPRITKVGRFIRKTSIDELPQLINVLFGDMSIVGNRPYLPREIEDMGVSYNSIIKTKPGITGLWQVSGRSDLSFKKRCQIESTYSNICSLKLDYKILSKTFAVVLGCNGAK